MARGAPSNHSEYNAESSLFERPANFKSYARDTPHEVYDLGRNIEELHISATLSTNSHRQQAYFKLERIAKARRLRH